MVNKKFLLWLEIIGDMLAAIIKLLFGYIGNSAGLIAEGFHSIADSANQIFLLIGIESSKKRPDKDHPFGYGKERFFYALLSAFFIMLFSGGMAIYQGFDKLFHPEQITNFQINFIILGIAFCFQAIILVFSTRHFQKKMKKYRTKGFFRKLDLIKEPTTLNLWFNDILAIAGTIVVAIALVLVRITGNSIFDAIASILIGTSLVLLGFFLAKDTKDLLIGEAVTPAMYREIREIIMEHENVEKIPKLKTMHLTPYEILINADVQFKDGLKTEELEDTIDEIEKAIRKEIPAAKQIFIEAEG